KCLGRGAVGHQVARGDRKALEPDGKPGNNRRGMRPLAHSTMTIERLDGRTGNTVAYLATEAAAGKNLANDYLRSGIPSMPYYVCVIKPLVHLLADILILLVPRLLNSVVAFYLIVVGLIGLWPRLFHLPH